MTKIFVFRHGQSWDNKNNVFSGWADPDLTPQGIEEAKQIEKELKDQKATKAYSSDLKRAIQTLDIVLNPHEPKPAVVIDKRLRERSYGSLTGKSKAQTAIEYPTDYPLWHRSYDVRPPGGESIEDVEKRVLEFLNEILPHLSKDDIIFISAHGNSIRPIRRYFEKISIDEMRTFEHIPAKVYKYDI